jgi:hypothetical protein
MCSDLNSFEIAVDRLHIVDLLYRCASALDTRNWGLLASCFVEDAQETFLRGFAADYHEIEAFCERALRHLETEKRRGTSAVVLRAPAVAGAAGPRWRDICHSCQACTARAWW